MLMADDTTSGCDDGRLPCERQQGSGGEDLRILKAMASRPADLPGSGGSAGSAVPWQTAHPPRGPQSPDEKVLDESPSTSTVGTA
jgi:hypothetical protein